MFRFQSTPSARRATGVLSAVPYISGYFNPRPPRGGRPGLPRRQGRHPELSSPALREEGDPGCVHFAAAGRDFNPRPPRGGRHIAPIGYAQTPRISIHALREEGDRERRTGADRKDGFQSTPSARRATRRRARQCRCIYKFQSTPSARRATILYMSTLLPSTNFNPRPPRGGRRSSGLCSLWGARYFNPRPPRGGRLDAGELVPFYVDISIHALREEGDVRSCLTHITPMIFQSTPSARRATFGTSSSGTKTLFQSTPSARRATHMACI